MIHRLPWNLLIKTFIIVVFGWFLAQRLNTQNDPGVLWGIFVTQMRSGSPWILCLVVLMMPLNWMMEIIKWRMLMRPAVVLSWRKAIAGVLSGIAFSLFTPNRIGEYGGRILYVDRKYTWNVVMASLTGSFAQNLVHISFGLVAAMILFSTTLDLPRVTGSGMWVLSACVIFVIWGVYWYLPHFARALGEGHPPRFLTRPWKALAHISQTTRRQLGLALVCAATRYAIFTLQYVLLLQYFGVEVPWIWLTGGVAVIYLMQTSIPLPPFVDLIARNELGIVLWAGFGINELSIIAAGLGIWILNLVLPALFGLLAIATVNILRSLGYENAPISSSLAQPPAHIVDRTAS